MTKVYIYCDKLLFCIYNPKNLLFIYTTDHNKLKVLRKDMVDLNLLLDCKSELVNFCNIFYSPKLKYNLFLVGTIIKARYSTLVKKKKILYDINSNITLKAIKIRTSYLVNILFGKKTLALALLYSVVHSHESRTK